MFVWYENNGDFDQMQNNEVLKKNAKMQNEVKTPLN